MEFSLTIDEFKHLVGSKCYYCDYYCDGESIGIDRLNNTLGYKYANCVAACEACNRSKHVYHPLFFIDKAKIISGIKIPTLDFYKKWDIYFSRSMARSYNVYKKEAESRSIPFNITEIEYDTITRSPCYLCGYKQTNGIGIDRVDNSIREYNMFNSRPCCGSCNIMKNFMNNDEFTEIMKRIATKWADTKEVESIVLFTTPYKKNVTIDTDTNQIIENVVEERKKWKALSLYYAIIANTESEFLEFNKDLLTVEEFETIAKGVRANTNKDECIKVLSTFLNTVRTRRARHNKKKSAKSTDSENIITLL